MRRWVSGGWRSRETIESKLGFGNWGSFGFWEGMVDFSLLHYKNCITACRLAVKKMEKMSSILYTFKFNQILLLFHMIKYILLMEG